MNKKTYDTLTTVSLFLIAASAILSDKFSGLKWVFGAIAGTCVLVSTWIYFNHGMKKARGEDEGVDCETGLPVIESSDVHQHVGSLSEKPCEPLYVDCVGQEALEVPEEPDDLMGIPQPDGGLFLRAAPNLRVSSFYISRIIARTYHRTFAEEVVGIVKGLTEPGENPSYEFEFKTDGTFRVVPCVRNLAYKEEKRKQIENFEAAEPSGNVLH